MDDSQFLYEVWEAAKLAGPFGTALMLFIWWRADTERIMLRTERDALLERLIVSMNTTTEAIKENTKAILFMDRRTGT